MASDIELGATIREARLKKSMSLGQLASAVGRSSSSVRRWERGEVAPAASVLPKLAAILEIDPESLTTAVSDEPTSDDATDPETESPDARISTVEQPVVEEPIAQPTDAIPVEKGPSQGLIADTWNVLTRGGTGWSGWIRGMMTVGLLLIMLIILLWAIGELVAALGDVWDSFDVGTNGSEDA